MAIVLNALAVDGTTGKIIGLPDNGRDSERYAQSDVALSYSVPAYAAAINGGRPVQNLFNFSAPSDLDDWTTDGSCTDNGDGTYTYTARFGDIFLPIKSTIPSGRNLVFTYEIEVVSGSTTGVWFRDALLTQDTELVFSGTNKCTINTTTSTGWSTTISLQYRNVGDFPTLRIISVQLEDATGRADTTTPSEYAATGTAKEGTELFPDVDVDTTDWIDFGTPTTNELSTTQVYSGTYSRHVVCDASLEGCRNSIAYTVRSGVKYIFDAWVYVVSGACSSYGWNGHLVLNSSPTTTTGAWEKISLIVTSVSSGEDNIRFLSSGGAAEFYVGYCSIKEATTGYAVYGTENGNSVASNVVTEGVGAALSPVPRLSDNPALTNSQTYSNDQSNAVYTATNVAVGAQDEDGLDGKPNGSCTLTATAANGTVIANAVTAASANQATRWFLKRKTGTGTIEITTDNGGTWTDVTSGITTSVSEVLAEKAAVANPQIGIRIVTSADAVIVGNAELHTNTNLENVRGCGPIFTTTTAVSTTADDYTYDIANHSDTELTYACEWTPGYSASEATGDQEIITLGTAPDMLYHDATNGDIESTDGTNTSTKAETITAGTTYDLEVAYSTGADSLQVSVDGVVGSDVSYDDAFPTGTKISLFRNSSFAQEMFAFTITEPDATSIPVFAHHYMHNIG